MPSPRSWIALTLLAQLCCPAAAQSSDLDTLLEDDRSKAIELPPGGIDGSGAGSEPVPKAVAMADAPSGRFVEYSRAARGSNGKVRLLAATYFGTTGDEAFSEAIILPDQTIVAAGTFATLPPLKAAPLRVFGTDLPDSRFPPPPPAPADSKAIPRDPKATVVLVHYSADLSTILNVIRFPYAAASLRRIQATPDGQLLIVASLEPAASESGLLQHVKPRIEENPAAVAAAAERNRRPGNDSLLLRIDPRTWTTVWSVLWKHRSIDAVPLANGATLVESGRSYFVLNRSGAIERSFDLPSDVSWRVRTRLEAHADGSFYIGGEYHSGTGREPYRNPLLHRFNPDGKTRWTAWNWTGPIVGNDAVRLVSDSAVRIVRVCDDDTILVAGWSDGGNTVFTRQPYDIEAPHGKSSFAGSTWGAGVLSVSHILRLDAKTMQVRGHAQWLSYLTHTNKPNSARIDDIAHLPDGRCIVVGGTSHAMIETPDAWITPFIKAKDDQPGPKGGNALVIYSPDFDQLLFATHLPCVRDLRLAAPAHGRFVIVGAAAPDPEKHPSLRQPLLPNALQPAFGGGRTDAYIMLVEAAK